MRHVVESGVESGCCWFHLPVEGGLCFEGHQLQACFRCLLERAGSVASCQFPARGHPTTCLGETLMAWVADW